MGKKSRRLKEGKKLVKRMIRNAEAATKALGLPQGVEYNYLVLMYGPRKKHGGKVVPEAKQA